MRDWLNEGYSRFADCCRIGYKLESPLSRLLHLLLIITWALGNPQKAFELLPSSDLNYSSFFFIANKQLNQRERRGQRRSTSVFYCRFAPLRMSFQCASESVTEASLIWPELGNLYSSFDSAFGRRTIESCYLRCFRSPSLLPASNGFEPFSSQSTTRLVSHWTTGVILKKGM